MSCVCMLCRHKPFQICRNTDHQFCENKAALGENRFAHSIEELVVWTVERHYSKYIHTYIHTFMYVWLGLGLGARARG